MDKKARAKFRRSKKWKEFRRQMKSVEGNRDMITGLPLRRDWNLHHLDLRVGNYDNLVPNRFIPLNRDTHEFVHWLYKIWKNDRQVLSRLEFYFCLMEVYTND